MEGLLIYSQVALSLLEVEDVLDFLNRILLSVELSFLGNFFILFGLFLGLFLLKRCLTALFLFFRQ